MNMLYFKFQKSLLLFQNYFVLFNLYSFIKNVFLNKKQQYILLLNIVYLDSRKINVRFYNWSLLGIEL